MKNYLLLLSLMVCVIAQAGNVSRQQAANKAAAVLSALKDKTVSVVQPQQKSKAKSDVTSGDPAYYCFNASDGAGFVILSGDDQLPEVFGYSKTGSIDMDNMTPGLKMLLGRYEQYVEAVRIGNIPVSSVTTNEYTPVVDTLLRTAWHQGYPYNKYAPANPSDKDELYQKKYPIGCVPTAFGQVLNYHRWPEGITPKGDIFNVRMGATLEDIPLDINSNPTKYDYNLINNNMLTYNNAESVEDYDAKCEATALFLRDLAYALSVNYDNNEGASNIQEGPMIKYFGYSMDGKVYLDRDFVGNNRSEEWINLVKENLDKRYPVVFSGATRWGDGHCFVLDGYDSGNRVHANFGWAGKDNGWYAIFDIGTGMNAFTQQSDIVSMLHPDYEGKGGTLEPSKNLFRQSYFLPLIDGKTVELDTYFEFPDKNSDLQVRLGFRNSTHLLGSDSDVRVTTVYPEGETSTKVIENVLTTAKKEDFYAGLNFVVDIPLNDILTKGDGIYTMANEVNVKTPTGETGWILPAFNYRTTLDTCSIRKKGDYYMVSPTKVDASWLDTKAFVNEDTKTNCLVNLTTLHDINGYKEGEKLMVCMDINFKSCTWQSVKETQEKSVNVTLKHSSGRVYEKKLWIDALYDTIWKLADNEVSSQKRFVNGYPEYTLGKAELLAGDYTMTVDVPCLDYHYTCNFTVGAATTISTPTVTAASTNSSSLYNIMGQRIAGPQRGLYIKNGKVYLQR